MSVKLTEQQRLAVNCRNGSLIVSAAATDADRTPVSRGCAPKWRNTTKP